MTDDLEMTFDPYADLGGVDEWLVARKAARVDAKTAEVTPAQIIADLAGIPAKDWDAGGYWHHHEDKLIERAADALSNWVREYLAPDPGLKEHLPLIQRMVAGAMMMQHEHDRAMMMQHEHDLDYEIQLRNMTDERLSQEWQRVEDALAFEMGGHGKRKYFISTMREMELIDCERARRSA